MSNDAQKTASAPKLVMPENALKKKVGTGGFNEVTLTRAQHMIENNTIDFTPQALEFLNILKTAIEDIKAKKLNETDVIGVLSYPAMQLKAQGALFHFPAITSISHTFVDLLEAVPESDQHIIELASAYHQVINAILVLQIKDENHQANKDLHKTFIDACNRYYKLKQIQ